MWDIWKSPRTAAGSANLGNKGLLPSPTPHSPPGLCLTPLHFSLTFDLFSLPSLADLIALCLPQIFKHDCLGTRACTNVSSPVPNSPERDLIGFPQIKSPFSVSPAHPALTEPIDIGLLHPVSFPLLQVSPHQLMGFYLYLVLASSINALPRSCDIERSDTGIQ